jgi:hypothetical protein
MTLASGCGSRTLVRIGGGNVKSIVVFLVLGIAAYMTMKGLFGVWRIATVDKVAVDLTTAGVTSQEIGSLLAVVFGVSKKSAQIGAGLVIASAMLVWVFLGREFRVSVDGWLGGLGYGLIAVAGWYITASIGFGENQETLEMVYFATKSQ